MTKWLRRSTRIVLTIAWPLGSPIYRAHGGTNMRTVDDPRVHADRSMRGAFFRAGDKGQSLVETALVLPVLLMFLLGILLCAITFYNYLTLTRAVTASASDLQNGGTGNIGPALPSPY